MHGNDISGFVASGHSAHNPKPLDYFLERFGGLEKISITARLYTKNLPPNGLLPSDVFLFFCAIRISTPDMFRLERT